jgi:hypothetical protein
MAAYLQPDIVLHLARGANMDDSGACRVGTGIEILETGHGNPHGYGEGQVARRLAQLVLGISGRPPETLPRASLA